MGQKKRRQGVVYSTNPDFEYAHQQDEEAETLPADKQCLRVLVDRKGRNGKAVTVVTGFVGSSDDLRNLAKMLKSKCGVGGSDKDGEILIQGEHRNKVIDLLKKEGYTDVKPSGG
jgi:translation initiation factor 1